MSMLNALWVYRGFILASVKREFQLKYRNSLLGVAWTLLNPVAMIVVYTVIFSEVMKTKLPDVDHGFAYSIYLCAGSLTWGLFAEIVGRGQNIFLDNANLMKKISFPRISLPVIALLNSLINFAIIFSLFLAFLIFGGFWPGWTFVAIMPVLAIQLLFAIGLGVSVGVLNVFFRDVGQFFGIFLQFWFWLTPIVYPASILPDWVNPIINLNPMYPLIKAYQGVLVNNQWPDWTSLKYPLLVAFILCFLGFVMFRKHAGEMVDEL